MPSLIHMPMFSSMDLWKARVAFPITSAFFLYSLVLFT